tara:strand:- start:254 stop:2836 length:2583 start_codon:yes stop_codon:yes gene_type:complete
MTGWYPYVTDWGTPKSKQQDEEKKQRNNYGILYNQQQNLKAKNDPGAQLLGMINDTLGATATVLKYNKERQDRIKEETILDLSRLQAEEGWDVEQQKKWRGQIEELEKEGGKFETFIAKLKKTNLPLANYLEKNGPKRILHVKRAFALDKVQNAENILQAHLDDETIQDHGRTNLEYYNSLESTTAKQDYRYKVVAAEFKGGTTHKGILFDDVIPELKKWSKVKEIKETATQNKGIITANIKAQDDEIFGLLIAAEANAGDHGPAAKRIEENITSIIASIDENSSEFTTSGLTKRQYATEIFAERFTNHIRGGLRADNSRISINAITGLYNATSESFKINGKQVTFGQLLMYDNSSLSLNNLLKAAETGAKASLKIQREGIEAEGNAKLDEYQTQCFNKGGCTVEEISQFAGEISSKYGIERESFNRLGGASQTDDAYAASKSKYLDAFKTGDIKTLRKDLRGGRITNEKLKKEAEAFVNKVETWKEGTGNNFDLQSLDGKVANGIKFKFDAGGKLSGPASTISAELKDIAKREFISLMDVPNMTPKAAYSQAIIAAENHYYNNGGGGGLDSDTRILAEEDRKNKRYYSDGTAFTNLQNTELDDRLGLEEVSKKANEKNVNAWTATTNSITEQQEIDKVPAADRRKQAMSNITLMGPKGYLDLIGIQETNQYSAELLHKARMLGVTPGELYKAQLTAWEAHAEKDGNEALKIKIDLQKADLSGGKWEIPESEQKVFDAASKYPQINHKLRFHGWESLSIPERLQIAQTIEDQHTLYDQQIEAKVAAEAEKAKEDADEKVEQDRVIDQVSTNEEQKGPSLAGPPTDTPLVDPTGMFDDSNIEETDEELAIKDQEYREQGLF